MERWELKRKSKDRIINERGRNLLDLVGEIGGYLLNGTTKEDAEGEFTYYIGSIGSSVIDYIIVNKKVYNVLNNFRVEKRMDSDHLPVMLEMNKIKERTEEGEERRLEEGTEERQVMRISWSKDAKELYKERTSEEINEEDKIGLTTEEKWIKLKEEVWETLVKKEKKIRKKKTGYKEWWNHRCSRKKRMIHRMYRR